MTKTFIIASAIIFLEAGCASAPGTHSVQSTRNYQLSYDQTWSNVVAYFASHNIQVKNIAKDSGVIYAETARFDDTMADCGKPGVAQVVGRQAKFNVFVKAGTGNTTVSVNTDFTETRMFYGQFTTVPCNSYGVLESSVLNAAAM